SSVDILDIHSFPTRRSSDLRRKIKMMTSLRSQSKLRAFTAKVRGFLAGQQHDDEFDDEVQAHLQLLADKFVQQGLSTKDAAAARSEEHTSELQSQSNLVCRL